MTDRKGFRAGRKDQGTPIDTPAGMAEPAASEGPAEDAADVAATDVSQRPSSRSEDTQPEFGEGRDPETTGELADLKERHLRLAAEFDNFRKRNARERAELADRAQARFVAQLLDVLDDLDRLVASDPATALATLREGLSAVDRKLWKQLEDAGVERVDPTGARFDPSEHEAVSVVPPPSPAQDHTVSAAFQPGYRFKGALVRPARVQVFSTEGSA